MADPSIIGVTLAGRFRITGVIGEGGMATVYRGQQANAKPDVVAIKVMNPDLAKDTRFVRRFRREAKAASMLKHPNTVQILEFGVDQEFVFLAMECLEGLDLALLLHRERRIPEVRAAHILIQVCRALESAHEMSIVHRDLKPDNIMLVKTPPDGRSFPGMNLNDYVKVLDFGIAKILDEDLTKGADPRAEPSTGAKSALTRVGTIVGTPAYMAPEQGRAEQVDARTDVYACGVLLYELLTGRVPFSGETPMQVVMRHVNEPPMKPSTYVPMHPALEAFIMKALAKYPAERQQNAGAFAADLVSILPELSETKREIGQPLSIQVSEHLRVRNDPGEGATLVIERPSPPPVAAAKSPSQNPSLMAQTPAFPTLNLDLPEELLSQMNAPARPAPTAPKPAPQPATQRAAPPQAFPAHPPALAQAAPDNDPESDSDDVRTLVARESRHSIPDGMQPLHLPPPPALNPPTTRRIDTLSPDQKISTLVSAPTPPIPEPGQHSGPGPSRSPGSGSLTLKGTVKLASDVPSIVIGAAGQADPKGTEKTLSSEAVEMKPPSASPRPPTPSRGPEDKQNGDRAVLPVAMPLDAIASPSGSKEAPNPVALWQPQQKRRLSGPIAMFVGIVIGALLFGIALIVFIALGGGD